MQKTQPQSHGRKQPVIIIKNKSLYLTRSIYPPFHLKCFHFSVILNWAEIFKLFLVSNITFSWSGGTKVPPETLGTPYKQMAFYFLTQPWWKWAVKACSRRSHFLPLQGLNRWQEGTHMSHQMNVGYSAPVSPCPIKMILLGHRTMSLEQKYHVKRYFYKQYMHVECLTTRSMDKISEYLMMLQVLWVLASHVLIAGQSSSSHTQCHHFHLCKVDTNISVLAWHHSVMVWMGMKHGQDVRL